MIISAEKIKMNFYFSNLIVSFVTGIILFSVTQSCNNIKSSTDKKLSVATKEETVIKKLNISYHYDTIRNDSALKVFKSTYSIAQQRIIAATNRLDVGRIRVKSALVIPDTILADFFDYSPFPETIIIPDSVPKFIMVNQRIQLFGAYENGKLVRFGPVSSGRKAKPTPNGLFYTNYKAKKKRSTVDGDWIMPWYFNIANKDGVGMHQYFLPGYPASHSCIRMYEENARWIFDWAEQWQVSKDGSTVIKNGTPVLVFGVYNFNEPSPWKTLPQNPNALNLTEEEIKTINDAILQIKIQH